MRLYRPLCETGGLHALRSDAVRAKTSRIVKGRSAKYKHMISVTYPSCATTWRMLKRKSLNAYNLQRVQALIVADYTRRVEHWILQHRALRTDFAATLSRMSVPSHVMVDLIPTMNMCGRF